MRSSSRDLVDRFTGNRAYFHRADYLRRWKNGVALAAIGLTLGWLAIEFSMPSRAASAHSHGPLANPHAAFDANCQACHASHSPREFLASPLSIFKSHDRWQSSSLTCTKCHAGPAHHVRAKDDNFHNDCANCHHDHNGRDHSLIRIPDNHCTRCHQNLPAHVEGHTAFAPNITGFARDHPEFKPLSSSPERGLKFSHALHLTAGLVYTPGDTHPWSPESLGKQLNTNVAARFTADGENRIQLKCGDCHQLDSGRTASREGDGNFNVLLNAIRGAPRQSILPARAGGAYYLPVNFDVHCKVCHPIRTPLVEKSDGGRIPSFFVMHRRQPSALKTLLRGEYAARLASRNNPVLTAPPGPGGRFDPKDQPRIVRFEQELDNLTDSALKVLLQNLTPHSASISGKPENSVTATGGFACGKCHYSAPGSNKEPPEKKTILPLPDRAVWFPHAKFNHVSHRGLNCAACHPGTADKLPPDGKVNETEPVLIASKITCQACHAPAGTPVESAGWQGVAGGIRHSCTDCHRYHNGDHPLQGLGSSRRDPANPLSLGEFLDGGKK